MFSYDLWFLVNVAVGDSDFAHPPIKLYVVVCYSKSISFEMQNNFQITHWIEIFSIENWRRNKMKQNELSAEWEVKKKSSIINSRYTNKYEARTRRGEKKKNDICAQITFFVCVCVRDTKRYWKCAKSMKRFQCKSSGWKEKWQAILTPTYYIFMHMQKIRSTSDARGTFAIYVES